MSSPHLSVVVGTYNRLEQVRRCIDSIFEQTSASVRVYVTDAGSTDGTIDYLRSLHSERLIPVLEGARLGQARAYNRVFEIVDTPYVAWLSDDNVVVNGGLDTAVHVLSAEPRIGMVGLKVRDMLGRFTDAPYIGGISAIGVLNVNQGVLRTDVLRRVGYFSETFRFYGIDPDLTAKVLLAGSDIVYTRQVAIHHYRAWADDAAERDHRGGLQEQSLNLYMRKYGQFRDVNLYAKAKHRLWLLMQARLGVHTNSDRYVLGQIVRDWRNILLGRYVSLLDPLWSWNKPYHLRQSYPASRRPLGLPADPVEVAS
jgi:GT2 family glycosyltransferase